MEPEIPNGSIITVDPGGSLYDGAFVVARVAGMIELRQLRIMENTLFLIATNDKSGKHVEVEISALRGVVTQCADTRRNNVRKFKFD